MALRLRLTLARSLPLRRVAPPNVMLGEGCPQSRLSAPIARAKAQSQLSASAARTPALGFNVGMSLAARAHLRVHTTAVSRQHNHVPTPLPRQAHVRLLRTSSWARSSARDLDALYEEGWGRICKLEGLAGVAAGVQQLRQAAAAGHVRACTTLAKLYFSRDREFVERNRLARIGASEAFAMAKRATSEGDPDGAYMYCYCHAIGVPNGVDALREEDIASASLLLEEVGRKGHPDARKLMEENRAAEALFAMSTEELRAAVESGDPIAMLYRARTIVKDITPSSPPWELAEAVRLLEGAAERGCATAMSHLAEIYENGLFGAVADAAKAVHWHREAARSGSPISQLQYGRFLLNGTHGVEVNEGEGFALIEMAAAGTGLFEAVMELGLAYMRGKGVPQDKARGIELLREAADGNNPMAMAKLAKAYMSGDGVAADKRAGLEWLTKAVKNGVVKDPILGVVGIAGMSMLVGNGADSEQPGRMEHGVDLLAMAASRGDVVAEVLLAHVNSVLANRTE